MHRLLTAIAIGTTSSLVAVAQQPVQRIQIDGAPTCAACSLKLTPVLQVRDTVHGSGSANFSSFALRIRGGVYLQDAGTKEIHFYDARGTYQRAFGRRGRGPGEFTGISGAIVDRTDSLWVFDPNLNRLTVFAPVTSMFVRTVPLPVRVSSWMFVSPTRLVATIVDAQTSREQFALLSREGALIRRFGAASGPTLGGRIRPARAPGRFWRVNPAEYQLEEWDSSGTVTRIVNRRADWWFTPSPADTAGLPPNSTSRPTIMDVREDSAGMLWVLTLLPNREYWGRRNAAPGIVGDSRSVPANAYSYVLEVLDVRGRRLHFTQTTRAQPFIAVDADHVAQIIVERTNGFQFVSFAHPSIVR